MSIRIFFISFFLLTVCAVVSAQQPDISCGTPDYDEATMDKVRESIRLRKNMPRQKSLNNYSIPIHLYIITKDDGTLPRPSSYDSSDEIIQEFKNALKGLNSNFHSNIDFYLCQIDILAHDYTYATQQPNSFVDDLFAVYPDADDDNAIRVFLNNEGTGVGGPTGVKFSATGIRSPNHVLHEFGHYFGLPHTFIGSFSRTDTNGDGYVNLEDDVCTALYPDHTPVLECFGEPRDCDGLEPGECYGDLIADTPVDRYNDCSAAAHSSRCPVVCPEVINGISYDYTPPFTNAMSYWQGTSSGLTRGQKERVYDNLIFTDPIGHPSGHDMSFLIDDDIPVCDDIEQFVEQIAPTGTLKIVNGGLEDENNFINWPMGNIRSTNGFGINYDRLGEGIFRMRRYNNFVSDAELYIHFNDFSTFLCDDEELFPHTKASDEINIFDMIRIQRHLLGIEPFETPFQLLAADVNYSGTVSIIDLLIVARIVLGIDTEFHNSYPWRMVPKRALTMDNDFAEAFTTDPFTAIWNFDGKELGYMPNDEQETYLGKTLTPDNPKLNGRTIPKSQDNPVVWESATWDFLAVKTGNVDFSYDGEIYHNSNLGCSVEVGAENYTLAGGKGLDLKLKATANNVVGVSLTIEMDKGSSAKDLSVKAAWLEAKSSQNFKLEHAEGNIYKVLWTSTTPVDFSSRDMFLTLQQNASRINSSSPIKISGELTMENCNGSTGTTSRRLIISKTEKKELANLHSLSAFPNPTGGEVIITSNTSVKNGLLTLSSLDGQSLQVPFNGQTLKLSAEQLSFFNPGIIIYSLKSSSGIVSGKIFKK